MACGRRCKLLPCPTIPLILKELWKARVLLKAKHFVGLHSQLLGDVLVCPAALYELSDQLGHRSHAVHATRPVVSDRCRHAVFPIGLLVFDFCDREVSMHPVPMLVADKPRSDGEKIWLKTPHVLHPDLMYDRPQLLEKLALKIDAEIFDLLYELCQQFNLLGALSEMEGLPGFDADPYPKYRGERKGYEIVGDYRPAYSE